MDRLKHIVILFVLINATITKAQQIVSIDETIFLHANATTFVSGETLLYKIHCLKSTDKTPSTISKIAYVELIDEAKKIVFKNKINLESSTGQAEYFIPTTVKTGKYKLIAYTQWMLNKLDSSFFETNITIINPYISDEKQNSNVIINTDPDKFIKNIKSTNSNIIPPNNIKLILNKNKFKNREIVSLNFKSDDNTITEGSFSLSVRKIEDLPFENQISAVDFSFKQENNFVDLQNSKTKIYLPELRGEKLSGKLIAKNNTDKVENKTIAFSLPGKNFIFKIIRTDNTGSFQININQVDSNSEITIQLMDEDVNNYYIKLDEEAIIDYTKLLITENYKLPPNFKEILINRSINSQIENAYYASKTDKIIIPKENPTFFHPLAKKYILDDYTRFNTLKETIKEVTTEVYYKQIDNKSFLHVNDPNVFPQQPDLPLVLIDGLYLENQNELFEYNMKNVFKIEIITGRYFLGSKFFNGLISFTTFNNAFKSSQSGSSIIKSTIQRPQPKKTYYKVNYSDLNINKRIPDFRNQLIWNPEVDLRNINTFYTSDVSGTFEIKLEGFAKNGTPVSLIETFEVNE